MFVRCVSDVLLRVLLIVQQLLQENKHGSKRDIYYMHPSVFRGDSFGVLGSVMGLYVFLYPVIKDMILNSEFVFLEDGDTGLTVLLILQCRTVGCGPSNQ